MRRTPHPVLLLPLALAAAAAPVSAAGVWRARLVGAEQVPPVSTRAQGEAIFRLQGDGSLHYRLTVANLSDVTMAHLHFTPAGQSGGVVAWLYPAAPPPQPIPGRSSGVLAEGTLTAASLVNALAGRSIADLIALFDAGQIYANVHSAAHGSGEIRGQVTKAGK